MTATRWKIRRAADPRQPRWELLENGVVVARNDHTDALLLAAAHCTAGVS
jgi:hypothetical protein